MARPREIQLSLPHGAEPRCYRMVDGAAPQPLEAASGPVEHLLLVPANRVSIFAVDLPELNPRRQAEALRWAVEDRIAVDPEAQHVVALERRDDGRLVCAVVARADMQRWLAASATPPDRILPDAACLPVFADTLVLMPFDGDVLIRAGRHEFDRLEVDLLEDLLPAWLERHPEIDTLVWLGDEAPSQLAGRSVEQRPVPGCLLDTLAAGAVSSRINLATGEFGSHAALDAAPWWRRAGVLAGLALVLLLAQAVTERWLLERARDHAAADIEQRFAMLFPDIETLVRPREQAERALAALGAAGGDRFISLMRRVVPLFVGASGIGVDALRFESGRLELSLDLPGMADLEALQRQLEAAGLEVEVGELTVQGERTRARLSLRERGP